MARAVTRAWSGANAKRFHLSEENSMSRISISLLCLLLSGLATAQTCNPNIRATAPDGRFQDNADGTVTDLANGLIWRRCEEGRFGENCGRGASHLFTWREALLRAQASTFAGYDDWRVPNLKELQSLVELRCAAPAINVTHFPNTSRADFWSSSPSAYAPGRYGWFVDFASGDYDDDSREFHLSLRLVRGGS